ncbi:unnamed protein product [Paramecium octaurelia]|uniref:Uncharacterized protein n=1 Tax=Paramecium octaurelia TaxID=43137 RepID=A0A8S1TSY9_PAROT|nr:unnamed protein product [Paramecium octaurelia]
MQKQQSFRRICLQFFRYKPIVVHLCQSGIMLRVQSEVEFFWNLKGEIENSLIQNAKKNREVVQERRQASQLIQKLHATLDILQSHVSGIQQQLGAYQKNFSYLPICLQVDQMENAQMQLNAKIKVKPTFSQYNYDICS